MLTIIYKFIDEHKNADKTTAYGPAFVKAYIMESKLAVYPRIIFTNNTFESYSDDCLVTNDFNDVSRRIIMSLDTKDDLFYVDYLKGNMYFKIMDAHKNPLNGKESYSIFNSIRDKIEKRISNETDPHIREKYLYLKNYYNQTILSVKELVLQRIPSIPFELNPVFEKNYFKNIQYTNKSNTQNYNNNINQQYIGGNATATIANGTKKSEYSISETFMEIFNNLPFEEQLEIMNIAVEKSKNIRKIKL